MPAYVSSPFGPSPILLVGGRAEFLLGSLSDTVSPTKIQITSVAITSNVATVIGTIVGGNAPAVGSLVSLQGTTTASGAFNVSNVALTGVTATLLTGAITITFALTHADVSTTTDHGFAVVPQPIVLDALANGSSRQCAPPENDPSEDDARTFTAQVFFGSLPTTATVVLQGALVDQDSAYQNLGTVATVTGGAVTLSEAAYTLSNYRFLRFNISGVTGGSSPTIAACLMG